MQNRAIKSGVEYFKTKRRKIELKKPKICNFQKGLDHRFCQKIKSFFIFCFDSDGTRKTDC